MTKFLDGIARALCVMSVCVIAGCSFAESNGESTPPATEFKWYETPEQLPAGTPGTCGTEGTYVYFGVFPQDVVPEANVTTLGLETSTTKVTRGYMEFVVGSDGNYYVKCAENAFGSSYKYNKDGTTVNNGGTSIRWFKVMPIKWRVVDTAYKDANGNVVGKLLVAENILTANVPYYESQSDHRNGTYPNNYMHSQIRAYLNGISYNAADSANENKWYDDANSKGKGFLQTAFGEAVITSIVSTVVDNTKEQMSYDGSSGMNNDFVCNSTTVKFFLLSEKEVVNASYCFATYNKSDAIRVRETTDFAKANYAHHYTTTGYGGLWLLRSPAWGLSDGVCYVDYEGDADAFNNCFEVYKASIGVVPALCIPSN